MHLSHHVILFYVRTRRSSDLISGIREIAGLPKVRGIQIDFDARASEREVYGALLESLQTKTDQPMRHRTRAPKHAHRDRKSTRLNCSHTVTSYAVYCLKNKL